MKRLLELIKRLLGFSNSSDSSKGFTLIELLIVIAVVGVLAAAVLIALNPLEQFRRARDAGLKQAMSTIGRQLQSNYTIAQIYPAATGTWLTQLVTDGVIVSAPDGSGVAITCTSPGGSGSAGQQNDICYKEDSSTSGTGNFIIYAKLEASVEAQRANCTSPATPWYVYQSTRGKASLICNNGEPTINGSYTYIDE